MKKGRAAAAAGLVLVAATVMASPGWGEEKEKNPEQKQEQRQEQKQEQKQQEKRAREIKHGKERQRERDELGPAAQVLKSIGRELHLSRAQRTSLREIVVRRAPELRTAAREVGEARRALREKVLADTADEAAIRGAGERLGAAIGSAAVLTARLAGEARPILTPAQRVRLQRMRERWEKRLGRGRERIDIWEGN